MEYEQDGDIANNDGVKNKFKSYGNKRSGKIADLYSRRPEIHLLSLCVAESSANTARA
jgi:hypothetical protein